LGWKRLDLGSKGFSSCTDVFSTTGDARNRDKKKTQFSRSHRFSFMWINVYAASQHGRVRETTLHHIERGAACIDRVRGQQREFTYDGNNTYVATAAPGVASGVETREANTGKA
jgi:hypothetical protein